MKNAKVSKKQRNSSIELLRILAMCGVIILHYNNKNVGGAFAQVPPNTTNQYILFLLESLSIISVNLFLIVSGYFLCRTKKRTAVKPLQLLIQVMLFGLGIYLYKNQGNPIDCNALLSSLIPRNYFVILYITMYVVSPYINLCMENLSKRNLNRMILILISFFSIYPTLVDLFQIATHKEWLGLSTIGMYGSQRGYTIVQFLLMYILGAWLYYGFTDNRKINSIVLSGIIVGCTLVLTCQAILDQKLGTFAGNTAWEYCNPIIIVQTIAIFLLFSKLHFTSKVVNTLSKGNFSVYLLMNLFLRQISEGIASAVQKPFYKMGLHLFLSIIAIYLICWMIGLLYDILTRPVFDKLSQYFEKKGINFHVDQSPISTPNTGSKK